MNFVCLDIGNVLLHVDFNPFLEEISKQFNITLEEADHFVKRNCGLHDVGLMRMEDDLRDYFKIKSAPLLQHLLKRWNEVISCNFQLIYFFLGEVQSRDLQIALLSNVGLEHSSYMKTILDPFYDHCIKHFSCFVGARKPNKLYYQSFLMQHPEFMGAAYLDDLHENLEVGQEFGLRPFHFSLLNETSVGLGLDNTYVSSQKLNEILQFIQNQ